MKPEGSHHGHSGISKGHSFTSVPSSNILDVKMQPVCISLINPDPHRESKKGVAIKNLEYEVIS